jgi:hypothetical protein
MRQTLLISMALITAFVGCHRQSTTTITPQKVKTMSYTLDVCGARKIQNPTEADIRQAVFALDTTKGDAFLVLGPTDMTYIQTRGDQKVGFALEYQETDTEHHYRAQRDLAADEIVKVLVSYSIGSDDWKSMVKWELTKW